MTSGTASRALLAVAAIAIGFAAADTYVVVMALPEMMTSSQLSIDELQRAAPIVSGFLLGYVGVLPLIGRVADVRGRVPVLLGCMAIFAAGSLVTAGAYDLNSMVVGRVLQGLGGGGLIPPTLALVAELWPPERRGLPLGIVSAVQEVGSVLGPLYGALVLGLGDWRAIFLINAAVAAVLAAALLQAGGRAGNRRPNDLPAVLLLAIITAAAALVLTQPAALATGLTTGRAFDPLWGTSRWSSPLAMTLYVAVMLLTAREATARRPLVNVRNWAAVSREVDLIGAGLMSTGLAAIIVTFASAEPERGLVAPSARWLLPVAAVAAACFVWRQRVARNRLVPRGALAARPAWGAIVVSFFSGVALIAALVDVPLFARLTIHQDSQLGAALVLTRFLVALPLGAVLGGWLLRRVPANVLTAAAMAMAAAAFWAMGRWDAEALRSVDATAVLVLAGLGFGIALAPVNAALLEHTAAQVHGVASALLIVARMIGMLVGISALTALGLWAFTDAVDHLRPVTELCGSPIPCVAYTAAVLDAGLDQLRAVFTGAALAAVIASLLAALLLRDKRATNRR